MPFIHDAKLSESRSAADCQSQTHVENYRNFSRVVIRLLSVVEILIKHSSLHDKTAYPVLSRVLQMSAQSFDTSSIFSFILISVENMKQRIVKTNSQQPFG